MTWYEALTLAFTATLCIATVAYAVFAWRLWKVTIAQQLIQERLQQIQESQHAIQQESLRIQTDPELGVDGQWLWGALDDRGFRTVTGDVWLYNAGPSPITITERNYTYERPGRGISIYDEKSDSDWLESRRTDPDVLIREVFPPIFLPGYGHKKVRIVCHADGLDKVVLTYSTSATKNKKAIIEPR